MIVKAIQSRGEQRLEGVSIYYQCVKQGLRWPGDSFIGKFWLCTMLHDITSMPVTISTVQENDGSSHFHNNFHDMPFHVPNILEIVRFPRETKTQ
jgi:hypothetical protein